VDGELRAHPKQPGVYELGLSGLTVLQCVGEKGDYANTPLGKRNMA